MNADLKSHDKVAHHSKVPPKAKYLKHKLDEIDDKDKWIEAPLADILDKTTDYLTTKVAEGELEVAEEQTP